MELLLHVEAEITQGRWDSRVLCIMKDEKSEIQIWGKKIKKNTRKKLMEKKIHKFRKSQKKNPQFQKPEDI